MTQGMTQCSYGPTTEYGDIIEEAADCLRSYQKGKSENTFHRHALPLTGEWQGSNFIVTNASHWTNPPTEMLPTYRDTPVKMTIRNRTPSKSQGTLTDTHDTKRQIPYSKCTHANNLSERTKTNGSKHQHLASIRI
jgi:hypothetical protein